MDTMTPNHALQRAAMGRRCWNCCVPLAGSLSLDGYPNQCHE